MNEIGRCEQIYNLQLYHFQWIIETNIISVTFLECICKCIVLLACDMHDSCTSDENQKIIMQI